jgi:membrane-bound lytic murein transglycosylase D
MPKTGTHFGLKQDWWFDGRRDIPGSTEVALNYLQSLNRMFDGDWLLALAAYNSGEGTVKKAMMQNRRANKKVDFFSLNLPKETRSYVPKMLALAYVVKHAHEFNVNLPSTENEAFLQQVTLNKQMDLALAAELAQIDLKALYHYNPGYTRWATHPKGPHHLLLPIKNAQILQKSLAGLDDTALTNWHRYQVKVGDTLANIAELYRTTSAAIKEANQLKKETLRVGQYLLIPSGQNRGQVNFTTAFHRNDQSKKSSKASKHDAKSTTSESVHIVRKGDSLWSISKQYGVSLNQLATVNELSPQASLKPGQRLLLGLTS